MIGNIRNKWVNLKKKVAMVTNKKGNFKAKYGKVSILSAESGISIMV